ETLNGAIWPRREHDACVLRAVDVSVDSVRPTQLGSEGGVLWPTGTCDGSCATDAQRCRVDLQRRFSAFGGRAREDRIGEHPRRQDGYREPRSGTHARTGSRGLGGVPVAGCSSASGFRRRRYIQMPKIAITTRINSHGMTHCEPWPCALTSASLAVT